MPRRAADFIIFGQCTELLGQVDPGACQPAGRVAQNGLWHLASRIKSVVHVSSMHASTVEHACSTILTTACNGSPLLQCQPSVCTHVHAHAYSGFAYKRVHTETCNNMHMHQIHVTKCLPVEGHTCVIPCICREIQVHQYTYCYMLVHACTHACTRAWLSTHTRSPEYFDLVNCYYHEQSSQLMRPPSHRSRVTCSTEILSPCPRGNTRQCVLHA